MGGGGGAGRVGGTLKESGFLLTECTVKHGGEQVDELRMNFSLSLVWLLVSP